MHPVWAQYWVNLSQYGRFDPVLVAELTTN